MSFWGKSFSFNGIPCEEFGLMLYDVGTNKNSQKTFASCKTAVEDHLPQRWKPIFYGAKNDAKLEFSIVFGVNPCRAESHHYLDSQELDIIANWLTGHNTYHWLEIDQDDMVGIRYNAMIASLSVIEYNRFPWAFEAKVICDSPYAYQYPQVFEFDVNDGDTITIYNESNVNDYLYPKAEVVISDIATSSSEAIQIRTSTSYPVWCESFADYETEDGNTITTYHHVIDDNHLKTAYEDIELHKTRYHVSDSVVEESLNKTGVRDEQCEEFMINIAPNVTAVVPHYIRHECTYEFISIQDALSIPVGVIRVIAPCDSCAGIVANFEVPEESMGGAVLPSALYCYWDKDYEFVAGDELFIEIDIANKSASIVNDIYSPKFSIINHSDNDHVVEFDVLKMCNKTISIDNDLGILIVDDETNPYQFFNFNFLRLIKGYNTLSFSGCGKLKLICEFPINVGG